MPAQDSIFREQALSDCAPLMQSSYSSLSDAQGPAPDCCASGIQWLNQEQGSPPTGCCKRPLPASRSCSLLHAQGATNDYRRGDNECSSALENLGNNARPR